MHVSVCVCVCVAAYQALASTSYTTKVLSAKVATRASPVHMCNGSGCAHVW